MVEVGKRQILVHSDVETEYCHCFVARYRLGDLRCFLQMPAALCLAWHRHVFYTDSTNSPKYTNPDLGTQA